MLDAAWAIVVVWWPTVASSVIVAAMVGRALYVGHQNRQWLNETEPCPRCGGAGRVPKEGGRRG